MTVEADRKVTSEFLNRKEGEIKAISVRAPETPIILHYQLVWQSLGNMPEDDQQIVIGGKYPTAEDAMKDVFKTLTKI